MSKYDNNKANNSPHENVDDFFAEFDKQATKGKSLPKSTVASRSSSNKSNNLGRRSSSQRSSSSGNSTSKRSTSSQRSSIAQRSNVSKRKVSAKINETKKRKQNENAKNIPPVDRTGRSTSTKNRAGGAGVGRANKKPASRKGNILAGLLYICLGMVFAVGIYVGIVFVKAPTVHTDDIYSMLDQRSIMYDANGEELENLYLSDGNRTIVDYDEMPENMVNAVVAIEDRKFWTHNGFNFIRMVGAIRDSIFGGGQISGTSTVTQQLARNVYLAEIKSQRSISRKLSEMYCTIVLEKNLSKEQIMEAYLNTIYLGFNSYGIQSAAQSYFDKDAKEMDVLECASLAALPQAPDRYALVLASYDVSSTLPVIDSDESTNYLYNGDLTKDRRDMIVRNMESQGFITAEEMSDALNDDLQAHIKLNTETSASATSYFTDYAIDQLAADIVSEYGISRSEAYNYIYTGGLEIYTTLDPKIQSIMEDEFEDDGNYSSIAYASTDSDGNLLNRETGDIMLYDYSEYFNDKDQFILQSDEYKKNDDGSLTILKGHRLNIYETEVNGEPDVSIEFKGMYTRENGTFYFIENGAISVPQGYKTVDGNGNAVISAQFFTDYPDFFKVSDGEYIVPSANYSLKQKTIQPQAAMVIMENSTGEVKAMVGGRETTGKQLYNRATNPRQPGSAMKPIGTYAPALQMSFEAERDGKTMRLDKSEGSDWGKYITAGSLINDAAMRYGGRTWPHNWYRGYRGQVTLRQAVEQSMNVPAVKTYLQIGPDYASSMLIKNGVTTVDDEGEVNDMNPAALALGGMTSGVSPLEMTAAYCTLVSGGVYKTPIAYTKVLDSQEEMIFEKKAEKERVYDEGVAWIMTDLLRTTVSRGIAGGASIYSQPVGGKTGTTSDNFDIWFVGFTPQYTSAVWMGNDVNIELSSGSALTASFWSDVMGRVCEGLPTESFRDRPANVQIINGEYYTDGTYSKVTRRPSSTKKKQTKTTTKATTTRTVTKIITTVPTKPPTIPPTTTTAPTTTTTVPITTTTAPNTSPTTP